MTEEKNLIFVEKFKEFDIFLDKSEEYGAKFRGINKKMDLDFEERSIARIKETITASSWKESNKEAHIKVGIFGSEIQKVKIFREIPKTEHATYKILDTTNAQKYEIGRESNNESGRKTFYPINDQNTFIFNEVKQLEIEVTKLNEKQKQLARTII